MLRGIDACHHSRMIGPGHSWIDGTHRSGDHAFPREFAQSWNGKPGIIKRVGGKAIQADYNNSPVLAWSCVEKVAGS